MWLAKYSDRTEKDKAFRDVMLATTIGQVAEKEYPGHHFRVDYESDHGIVTLTHPLAPKNTFYVIKLRDLASDPGYKSVKKAAGELLERAFQPRGKRREEDWAAERKRNHRAIHGMLTERNWVTGETRYVLPSEWQR
jgi:hypothetical protein